MAGCDVIVIGGGHNGLVTAARLAGAGRRVVLLERGDALGGLAAGDEFHPGYTTVGMHHDTTGLRPQVVEALDLETHGLILADEPAPVFAPQIPESGPGLLLHRDSDEAAGEIAAHSSDDALRYRDYRAFIARMAPFTGRLLDAEPPVLTGPATSLAALAGRGLALRRLGRADMMELLRIGPMCVADWMNEHFRTELLSCAVAAPALYGTRSGPWSPGSAANLLRVEALSGRAVAAGPTALIDALATAARTLGVEIRTGVTVAAIRTAGGAVTGVTLAGGETIDAPVVASSVDPKQTFLELLHATALAPTLVHQVTKLRTSGATAKVDLALRGPLRFACRPDLEIDHARTGETLDDVERAFDATKYRRCSERPVLDISVPSAANPDFAPADHAVVSIVAHFAPRDLEPAWSDESRERLGDAVVAELGRYAPDLPDRIVARRVLTPEDIERRFGVTGGHIHHVEHALDQLIVRPTPSCARYATPVGGLYLCGSGSHPGGGLTGAPGLLAAAAILERG